MEKPLLIDPQKLKQARGLRTLSAAARGVGISPTHLMYLERGEREPSSFVLSKLCKLYGVKVTALISENFLVAA